MRLLAVNTSNRIASVAIFEDGELLGERFSEDQKMHSEKLLPILDELLKSLDIAISDIGLFSVAVGPGSFTGIRIGVATIKGMAQALNKKVIPVTSLEGLLDMSDADAVCAIINARHGNLYEQHRISGEKSIPEYRTIDEIVNMFEGKRCCFAGDGTLEYRELLASRTKGEFIENIYEKASNIGTVAWRKFLQNNSNAIKPQEVMPIYLRKAQPERGNE